MPAGLTPEQRLAVGWTGSFQAKDAAGAGYSLAARRVRYGRTHYSLTHIISHLLPVAGAGLARPTEPTLSLVDRLQDGLGHRYRIQRELGRGGMATVYLAEDVKHGCRVALKVLRPEIGAALGGDRFLREIKTSATLQHPHILGLLDSGEISADHAGGPALLFYTMPYVDGESLRDRLDRERQLPLDQAVTIAREVADALGHAHAHNVVHRDIKPENILLSGGHAMVADFGIAKALDSAGGEKLTETGLALGTPYYMSPEQATGDFLDGRADQYALGCVLYEMLAGTPPFQGSTGQSILARHAVDPVPSLRTVRATIPAGVERAITRSLAKCSADRFPTTAEFAQALIQADAAQATVATTMASNLELASPSQRLASCAYRDGCNRADHNGRGLAL